MKKILQILFILLLSAQIFAQTATQPSGDGSAGSPYLIASLNNLYWISKNSSSWGSDFKQTENIEASSTGGWGSNGFSPIGNYTVAFSGNYDGQGHTITGLYIRNNTLIGLFGKTSSVSTIKNLGLVDVDFENSVPNGTGSLIGYSQGTVQGCFSSGSVAGVDYVGGFVGDVDGGNYTDCYTTCTVSGSGVYIGGFVGASNGTGENFNNCYSVGEVTGSNYIGGFAGYYDGNENNTCFWDITSSGLTNGYGTDCGRFSAFGKTTADMQMTSTFTEVGWDFTNTWIMYSGYYPSLRNVPDPALPVKLTSFTAALVDEGIQLNWETATEVNNYGFEVERQLTVDSDRFLEWKTIGFIEGHGNSNSPKYYEYIDANVPAGQVEYRLKQIDTDGGYEYYNTTAKVDIQITDVNDTKELPTEFALEQNYPNPFNPTTVINYSIPVVETFGKTSQHTTLIVYDLLGREVATLVNKQQAAGNYSVSFNVNNLASGMYIYRIKAGDFVQSRKMLLLR